MKRTIVRHPAAILAAVALCMTAATAARAQVSFGVTEKFNDGWLFILDDDPSFATVEYSDTAWRSVRLPHDWSIEGIPSPTLASCTGYLPGGTGWYRKHFTVGKDLPRHYVYFEGVYNRSEVYLNGNLLGSRPNGYISFLYDMTPYLQEGENVLAVRVDHSRYADSRWYSGSGIYRDVWLVASGDVHFAQWGVCWSLASLDDGQAAVNVEAEIEGLEGSAEVVFTLTDAQGRQVAQGRKSVTSPEETSDGAALPKASLTLNVDDPQLWSLDSPYLYKLTAELVSDGEKLDCTETAVGLRTLTFDPDSGFALNGEWMKVKGVCIHHDAGVLGAAVPEQVWDRRLRALKSMGANAVRLSHNTQAPALYDLCDRLGLLVLDEASDEWEFPKRKWLEGWNVGVPNYDGSYDFFEEWIETDVADMVRRDRNHPSVFLWSIGNEVDYPNDPYSHPILDEAVINQPMFGGYDPEAPDADRIGAIARRLAPIVRSIDSSRPVTGALAGVVMSNETGYPQAVDVVGYNYTEDRYDLDHETYPDRIVYGSETGTGIDAWQAVRDRDFIFGQFVWTGIDYLGESNRWPSRGFGSGLLDFGAFRKPTGWLRASLWSDEPVTYVGTVPVPEWLPAMPDGRVPDPTWMSSRAYDIWNYDEGQSVRVMCFTNAPQARLLLDGEPVGEMKQYDDKTGVIWWDIPFSPGCLTAEGCDGEGNVLSSYSITTSSRPYALRARVDGPALSEENPLSHIIVEVIDENGVTVKLADNNVTCRIDGPAELLGLENSDNTDMSAPQGLSDPFRFRRPGAMRHGPQDSPELRKNGERRVYHGRLLAYVRAAKVREVETGWRVRPERPGESMQFTPGQDEPMPVSPVQGETTSGAPVERGPQRRPVEPNQVRVTFSSPLLQSAELLLTIE